MLSAADLANLPHILPYFAHSNIRQHCHVDLSWYSWWINQQLVSAPQNLLSVLPGRDQAQKAHAFVELWDALGVFLSRNSNTSIDDMVQCLLADNIIEGSPDNESRP